MAGSLALNSSLVTSALFSLQQGLSFVFFLLLDITDSLLCFVFSFCDTLAGDHWGPCYCYSPQHSANQIIPHLTGQQEQTPSGLACLPTEQDPLVVGIGEDKEHWGDPCFQPCPLVSVRKRTLKLGKAATLSLPVSQSLTSISELLPVGPSRPPLGSPLSKSEPAGLESLDRSSGTGPELRRAVSSSRINGRKWTDCWCTECAREGEADESRLHVEVLEPTSQQAEPLSAEGTVGAPTDPSTSGEQPTTSTRLSAGDVVFLHGFCSSSSFWADTAVPHLSSDFRRKHRLLLVDLLGFGRSPKPGKCLYTVGEHAQRIEADVLAHQGVRKFHIVAHSMGCTVALALAARNPASVQSITLFSPPYAVLSDPTSSAAVEFFRFSAPRVLGAKGMDVGVSIMAWYEHVGRLLCCFLNKGHRLWEPLAAGLGLGRLVPLSFIRDFMRHTHHSAWHCYFNTICQGAALYPFLLSKLQEQEHSAFIVHGQEDTLCPVEASRQLARDHPNVAVLEVPGTDHVSVVLGREGRAAAVIEEKVTSHETLDGS